MEAPSSQEVASQVQPGVAPYVPAHVQPAAEAFGGGSTPNQNAATLGQASQHMTSGIQLEEIRLNRTDVNNALTQYIGAAQHELYNSDPANPGLAHQPIDQFRSNVNKVRQKLGEVSQTLLDNAPNSAARTMLQTDLGKLENTTEYHIQSAGFHAQQAENYSSFINLGNSLMSDAKNVKTAAGLIAGVNAGHPLLKAAGWPYFGPDDPRFAKAMGEFDEKYFTTAVDALVKDGHYGAAKSILYDSKAQELVITPGRLEELQKNLEVAEAPTQGLQAAQEQITKAGVGKDSEAAGLKKLNNDNLGLGEQAFGRQVKSYQNNFNSTRTNAINYYKEYGYFPAEMNLSIQDQRELVLSIHHGASDPVDLTVGYGLVYNAKNPETKRKGSPQAANADLDNPFFLNRLSDADRTTLSKARETLTKRGDADPQVQSIVSGYAAAASIIGHLGGITQDAMGIFANPSKDLWKNSNTTVDGVMSTLGLSAGKNSYFRDANPRNTIMANYINSVISWSVKNPGVGDLKIYEHAAGVLASMLNDPATAHTLLGERSRAMLLDEAHISNPTQAQLDAMSDYIAKQDIASQKEYYAR